LSTRSLYAFYCCLPNVELTGERSDVRSNDRLGDQTTSTKSNP
jgi:hypothetical protein